MSSILGEDTGRSGPQITQLVAHRTETSVQEVCPQMHDLTPPANHHKKEGGKS